MSTHIYYHADMDGYASGAIAALGLSRKCGVPKEQIILHKIQYGDLFDPEGLINLGEDVLVMVDFALQNDEHMLELLRKGTMLWIDHHQTSLEFLSRYPSLMSELPANSICVDTSKAACELTWRYFFNTEPPLIVKLIGAYDTWTKDGELDWDKQILPAHIQITHMQSDIDPLSPTARALSWWDWLFVGLYDETQLDSTHKSCAHEHYVHHIIDSGKKLLSFQESMYKDIANQGAYEAIFCRQYKAICLNTPIYNSRVFEVAFDVSQYDLMVAYGFNGSKWRVSLYTVNDNVSCSELAKQLGQEGPYKTGGGHHKAAGFLTSYELLNSYIEIKEKS